MYDDRCPQCHGTTADPGELCPPCQEEVEAIFACPGCGGTTPQPGDYCPVCEEEVEA